MSYQLNKKDVLFRQRLLKASGFDPKGLDGVWGRNTSAADDAFLAASITLRDQFGTFDARSEGNILGLHIKDDPAYSDLAGRALVDGLEWGGAWKNYPDPPHYQLASPYRKISEIRKRFEAGESYV